MGSGGKSRVCLVVGSVWVTGCSSEEVLSSSGIPDTEKGVHELPGQETGDAFAAAAVFFLCYFAQSRKNIEREMFKFILNQVRSWVCVFCLLCS